MSPTTLFAAPAPPPTQQLLFPPSPLPRHVSKEENAGSTKSNNASPASAMLSTERNFAALALQHPAFQQTVKTSDGYSNFDQNNFAEGLQKQAVDLLSGSRESTAQSLETPIEEKKSKAEGIAERLGTDEVSCDSGSNSGGNQTITHEWKRGSFFSASNTSMTSDEEGDANALPSAIKAVLSTLPNAARRAVVLHGRSSLAGSNPIMSASSAQSALGAISSSASTCVSGSGVLTRMNSNGFNVVKPNISYHSSEVPSTETTLIKGSVNKASPKERSKQRRQYADAGRPNEESRSKVTGTRPNSASPAMPPQKLALRTRINNNRSIATGALQPVLKPEKLFSNQTKLLLNSNKKNPGMSLADIWRDDEDDGGITEVEPTPLITPSTTAKLAGPQRYDNGGGVRPPERPGAATGKVLTKSRACSRNKRSNNGHDGRQVASNLVGPSSHQKNYHTAANAEDSMLQRSGASAALSARAVQQRRAHQRRLVKRPMSLEPHARSQIYRRSDTAANRSKMITAGKQMAVPVIDMALPEIMTRTSNANKGNELLTRRSVRSAASNGGAQQLRQVLPLRLPNSSGCATGERLTEPASRRRLRSLQGLLAGQPARVRRSPSFPRATSMLDCSQPPIQHPCAAAVAQLEFEKKTKKEAEAEWLGVRSRILQLEIASALRVLSLLQTRKRDLIRRARLLDQQAAILAKRKRIEAERAKLDALRTALQQEDAADKRARAVAARRALQRRRRLSRQAVQRQKDALVRMLRKEAEELRARRAHELEVQKEQARRKKAQVLQGRQAARLRVETLRHRRKIVALRRVAETAAAHRLRVWELKEQILCGRQEEEELQGEIEEIETILTEALSVHAAAATPAALALAKTLSKRPSIYIEQQNGIDT